MFKMNSKLTLFLEMTGKQEDVTDLGDLQYSNNCEARFHMMVQLGRQIRFGFHRPTNTQKPGSHI